jgi:ribose transport system permease protein
VPRDIINLLIVNSQLITDNNVYIIPLLSFFSVIGPGVYRKNVSNLPAQGQKCCFGRSKAVSPTVLRYTLGPDKTCDPSLLSTTYPINKDYPMRDSLTKPETTSELQPTVADSPAEPETTSESQIIRTAGNLFRRAFAIPEVGVFLPLLGFILIFYLINPGFLNPDNMAAMVRAMSFIGVAALGQTLLLISGAFDLSVGSVAGLGAIVCSALMVRLHWSIPAAVLGGLATGAVIGLANSFFVLKLSVPPFIATLGMLYIAKGIDYLISKGYTIYPLPDIVNKFGTAEPFNTSWSFIIFVILAVIAAFVVSKTSYGRKLYAVGGNPEVARLAGISPAKIQLSGFVLSGMCASLAGMLLMARIVIGSPTIGMGWELNVIAGVVIGGVSLFGGSGSIPGAVIGLLIMQVVTNGLVVVKVDPYWQTVAIGLLMITAVAIDVLRRKSKTASL